MTIQPEKKEVDTEHVEGSNGYVELRYIGEGDVRVKGCLTHNRYLFTHNVVRKIDAGDADCLFDIMPGRFVAENYDTESGYGRAESVAKERTKSGAPGNGQVHEKDTDRFSGDGEDLEEETIL